MFHNSRTVNLSVLITMFVLIATNIQFVNRETVHNIYLKRCYKIPISINEHGE